MTISDAMPQSATAATYNEFMTKVVTQAYKEDDVGYVVVLGMEFVAPIIERVARMSPVLVCREVHQTTGEKYLTVTSEACGKFDVKPVWTPQ